MSNRTMNAKRNSIWGLINKMVMLLLPFFVKSAIIQLVGVEYLGISGLFTSILNVLNITELGFGNAIVYSMYKPIAEDNKEEICALLNFYKKIYRIIGVFILVAGLLCLPFLPVMIKSGLPEGMNMYVLYLMYLINACVSYWLFSYKRCLLHAHQREDVLSKVSSIINILLNIIQLLLLFLFKNYYLFVVAIPIITICHNLVDGYIVEKMYPEYREKGNLKKGKIKDIRKQVVGLSAMRIATISRNSLDSIVISAFLGLSMVAVHNNYFYIINALSGIMAVLTDSIAAGIGNSIASESKEKNHLDMRKINMAYMSITGVFAACLICLYQPFMKLWVGEELVLKNGIMGLYVLYFYVARIPNIAGRYFDSAGLWWQGKWKCFVETGVNLVLNIGLGYKFGISGIIMATIISALVINVPLTVNILFKNYFKTSRKKFYKDHGVMLVGNAVAAVAAWFICSLLPGFPGLWGQLLGLAIRGIIAVLVWIVVFVPVYCGCGDYRASVDWLRVRLLKR